MLDAESSTVDLDVQRTYPMACANRGPDGFGERMDLRLVVGHSAIAFGTPLGRVFVFERIR